MLKKYNQTFSFSSSVKILYFFKSVAKELNFFKFYIFLKIKIKCIFYIEKNLSILFDVSYRSFSNYFLKKKNYFLQLNKFF